MSSETRRICLASPRGFCAGVRRALDMVADALKKHGSPIYVLHEIVHNEYVVDGLKKQGVIFVESLAELPSGSLLIFSAHGVSRAIEEEAARRGLRTIDATCPLVKRIHQKARSFEERGIKVILIGHPQHPEISGTLGQIPPGHAIVVETAQSVAKLPGKLDSSPLAYLTQTTLSIADTAEIVKALQKRFPQIEGSGDICYATRNRQEAVRLLAANCDAILIIGSPKSSNSNRLRETAEEKRIPAWLLGGAKDVSLDELSPYPRIGISAGASAPECLVEELISFLQSHGWPELVEIPGPSEDMSFPR